MTNNNEPIPLDPSEGPTIWLRPKSTNQHTHTLIVGTDPDNPLRSVEISEPEIKRMYHEIDN